MADKPLKNKLLDLAAPTPQNTPSQSAPISSHAQQPGVASIKEEDADRAAAASIFASNPHLVQMIQGRLGNLVGKSSGYIESLPVSIQRRLTGLKGIQKEHTKLEGQFQSEVLELEKKYFKLYTPLYQKRAAIINGDSEPTEDELKAGEQVEEERKASESAKADKDSKAENTDQADKPAAGTGDDIKGIPEFWLSAMKNEVHLADMITERDEEALRHLVDIRMEYPDKPGFRLIFEFSPNKFFSNKTLVKSYFYQEENGYGGDYIYDHAEGSKIEWHEGKDLTVKTESKKQRNKNTKQTRIVKKTVPTESFFNFFSPPKVPGDDDDDAASDIEERLELDYQLGEDIKEKLIPHAVDWFTGEAIGHEELDDQEWGEFDDDDDDDDALSDEQDDDDESDDDDGAKPKQEAAECKQS